jgi:hypothetical protein
VWLVERVELRRPARRRGGEFEREEHPAEEIEPPVDRHRRVALLCDRGDEPVVLDVRRAGVRQVLEYPVSAVGAAIARRLVGRRKDAATPLADAQGV